ncbi:CRISPR-associated protein Cas5 [Desulfovibrio sp. OttesenSCG-928-A18]|nr:CRISPR-associated protein Cas5 [Desulfovibrio sp. OttesenSCG-928-A18]
MAQLFYPIAMEISGSTAMWTRPDTGDCPVSYPAPTYSAVKALFESILWGPAVEIVPVRVELCTSVQYHSYVTNYGGPLRKNTVIKSDNNYQLFATVLIDVCYKLYARVGPSRQKDNLPKNARQWDKKTTSPGHAYQAIFTRRLERGQCRSIPALGWREFTPSYYGPLRAETRTLSEMPSIAIPSMLREVFPHGYDSAVSFMYDQHVSIENGCLTYPAKGDAHAE